MQYPNFTEKQYMDAAGVGGFNAAMGTLSGSVATVGSGVWAVPGLLAPEAMTVSFSGMTGTIGLPRPWGIVFGSGVVVRAHGTLTGQDTTNYSVNLGSLVPGSGSVTALVVATAALIQQNPFPVPGPAQGDPGYDPNFSGTVGYATNTWTVSLAAQTGATDGVNSFELFRTTLVSGQTSVTGWTTAFQSRATPRRARSQIIIASGGILPVAYAQMEITPSASGLTSTLPAASGAVGLFYDLVNTNSFTWTISTSDSISGLTATGTTSFTVPGMGACRAWSNGSGWMVVDSNPVMSSYYANLIHGTLLFSSAGSWGLTIPNGVYTLFIAGYAGGGGAGGSTGVSGTGGGGGGAAYFERTIAVVPGQVVSGTVGGGGTGNNISNGFAGGNTTVSTHGITAGGGGAGLFGNNISGGGGAGGLVSGTVDLAIDGDVGGVGYPISNGNFQSGLGGATWRGSAHPFVSAIPASGPASPFPGAGGTGGTQGGFGANGNTGYVYLKW